MPSNYRTALIKNISPKKASILLSDGSEGYIPLQNAVWARRKISYESKGKAPTDLSKLINIGDIVPVIKPIGEDAVTDVGACLCAATDGGDAEVDHVPANACARDHK